MAGETSECTGHDERARSLGQLHKLENGVELCRNTILVPSHVAGVVEMNFWEDNVWMLEKGRSVADRTLRWVAKDKPGGAYGILDQCLQQYSRTLELCTKLSLDRA